MHGLYLFRVIARDLITFGWLAFIVVKYNFSISRENSWCLVKEDIYKAFARGGGTADAGIYPIYQPPHVYSNYRLKKNIFVKKKYFSLVLLYVYTNS